MPYSQEHKEKTRRSILDSAYRLFTAKGFQGATVNEIMENCELTRGAFYNHFSSKADLYGESIKYAASTSKISGLRPDTLSDKKWLAQLLDWYLSIEHVNGTRPCPLAALVTDIASQDSKVKLAYATIYAGMNKSIMAYANSYTKCTDDEILSLTAMIIGAVAISRTIDNKQDIKKLLAACRYHAGITLGGI